MSRLPPTDDQRRAIETSGTDLCVVAGAGTGKTFTLTQRIVARVRAGVPLRRILAITFTEKAAAEMKERLAGALADAGHADARHEVETAAISTVHSFCARLLRDHAIAAGVDPAFGVLDEIESSARLEASIERLTDELRDTRPAAFESLASLGGDDPAETLATVFRLAQESGRPPGEFVRHRPGLDSVPDLVASVRSGVAAVASAASSASRVPLKSQQVIDAVLAAAARMPSDTAPVADLRVAVAAIAACIRTNVAASVKPALEGLRDDCEDRFLPALAEHDLAPLREVLASAVERLDVLYGEAKGRGEELDFADLERRAVDLLASRDDVRAAVRTRWTEVLVDEFQDTNPVQARLVDLLRPPRALFVVGDPKQSIYGFRGADLSVFAERLATVAAEGRDGVVTLRHSHRSRPEILGFVPHLFPQGLGGDGPMGDVRMIARRAWAPPAAPCVEIAAFTCNALPRGREAEAAWIARRIAAVCDGSFRVAAPTVADPLATRPADFGDVAVLLRATTHVKTVEQALVAMEIPYVVVKGRGFFRAREVVDLTHLVECVDDPRADLPLAAVLRSPACGLSDDALFAFTSARARIGDPRERPGDRALEPLWDVLTDWADGRRDVPALPPGDAARAGEFVTVLRDLRARRGTDGTGALVERIFDRLRLDVLALGRPNGRQRAANLRKVRTLAREAEEAGRSLAEFAEELRDLRAAEVREAEASVGGGARGTVSVMTIHAAKGLEFPVVFVPDCGHEVRPRASPVVATMRSGIGLPDRSDASSPVKPHAWKAITDEIAAGERAESLRLLYVAVTRAADHLVLTGALTDSARKIARPWWDRIEPFVRPVGADGADSATFADTDLGPGADEAGATRVVVRSHTRFRAGDAEVAEPRTLLGRVAGRLARGEVPSVALRPEAIAAAESLASEAARRAPDPDGTPFAANVSALTAFARCPQEYRLRYVVGVPEDLGARPFGARTAFDVDEPEPSDDEIPGDTDEPDGTSDVRALGRAVHAALERLVPGFDGSVRAESEAALRAETGGAAPAPSDVDRVVEWIEGFRASELAAELRDVSRADIRREQAFLLRAGRTTIRGQIDLVWRGANGWTLVDYKTGGASRPRPEHELQMRLYALGVEGVTGARPARLALWSLPHRRAIDVRFDDEDRLDIQALLAEFATRTARRDHRPRSAPPCADCRVRAACAFAPRR